MWKFAIILIVSYLLGNTYIFVRGLQALGPFSTIVRILFGTVFWTGALLIFAVFLLRDARPIPFAAGHLLYQIGTGWLVFTLYMVIFLACADVVKLFYKPLSCGFAASFLLTAGLLIYGYVNQLHVRTQTIRLSIDKQLIDREKLKIVAISDWHLGLGTGKKQLKRNIDRINAEKPDLILIAGDLLDNSVTPVADNEMDKELNRLSAPLGIYMAPGNHEYISGINECIDFISKTKIQLLKDSIVTLSCGLQIIGRDDNSNRNRLAVKELTGFIDKSLPAILIDHQPHRLGDAEASGVIDLQFSGHTHDGQIFPLSLLTGYLFDISYGYEKRGNTNFYVSSGLSLWGPPFRIGTCSEIVVFECSFTK